MTAAKKKTVEKSDWTQITDSLAWDDVGGRLLANIAKGIYNHEAVLREYVQNACDAYNMLDDTVDAPLIAITAEGNNVSVQDFGIGMDEAHIRSVKKVAVSNKDDFEDVVGFRGIGVWAGLQACQQLEIETTKQGVDKKYRLTIDFAAITEKFDENINIKELIDPHYVIESSPAPRDDHYTRTNLKGILHGYEKLLDADELKRIVATLLPCRMNPNGTHTKAIETITSKAAAYRDYVIKVAGNEVFRRFPADEVNSPEEQILKNAKGEELARVWYCATKKDSLDIAGFQLRVRNFGVGSQNIYSDREGHSYGVFSGLELGGTFKLNWFFGEIHVTNSAIRPNTPRNDLEIDSQARELIQEIRTFYSRRLAEANARADFNGYMKALEHAESATKGSTSGSGAFDASKINSIVEKLEKAENRAKRAATVEKDIILKNLLKQPQFVTRRKAALAKLRTLAPAPKAKSTGSSTGSKGKKATTTGNTTPKPSATREELISSIIALLEEKIGAEHEEFSSLCTEISQLITNFGNGDA